MTLIAKEASGHRPAMRGLNGRPYELKRIVSVTTQMHMVSRLSHQLLSP